MNTTTKTKNSGSSTNMDATGTTKQESGEILTKTERIPNSPFIKRWENDHGWSYGLPGYRISEWYETEKEMMKNLEKKDWNTISGMIAVMIETTLQLKNIK